MRETFVAPGGFIIGSAINRPRHGKSPKRAATVAVARHASGAGLGDAPLLPHNVCQYTCQCSVDLVRVQCDSASSRFDVDLRAAYNSVRRSAKYAGWACDELGLEAVELGEKVRLGSAVLNACTRSRISRHQAFATKRPAERHRIGLGRLRAAENWCWSA